MPDVERGIDPRWGPYVRLKPIHETVEHVEQPDGLFRTTITAFYQMIVRRG